MCDKIKHLYLAYGSNLNEEDWATFCKNRGYVSQILQFEDVVKIPDYKLVFDWFSKSRNGGVANIKHSKGHYVDAVLFSVDDEGLEALRAKEGHPFAYLEKDIFAIKSDGTEVEAKVYIVPTERSLGYVKPSQEYYQTCKKGYQAYNLSLENLQKAAGGATVEALDALFTYGTLMRGEVRNSLVANFCKLDGNVLFALSGTIRGNLTTNNQFPALDLSCPGNVAGDLMRFKNISEVLNRTDEIEGFKCFGRKENFFRRTLAKVSTGGFEQDLAWVYVFDGSLGSKIISNDWRMHNNKRDSFYKGLLETYGQFDPTFGERLWGLSPSSDVEQMMITGTLSERDIASAAGIWCVWPKEH